MGPAMTVTVGPVAEPWPEYHTSMGHTIERYRWRHENIVYDMVYCDTCRDYLYPELVNGDPNG